MKRMSVLLFVLAVFFLGCKGMEAKDGGTLSDSPYIQNPWRDDFTNFNTELWRKYNNYTWDNNGSYMRTANAEYSGGIVSISMIKNDPAGPFNEGRSHSCGQLYNIPFKDSRGYDFRYGKYVVRMKAATGSGVVSSFFLFRWDPWQEIDIEFLGKDTSNIHLNIFYNSGTADNASDDPEIVPLGFDAAEDFHTYAIEWEADHISWYVDGDCIRTRSAPAKKIPYSPMNLAMNVWNCNSTSWAGDLFTDAPNKRTASYDYVEYYPSGKY